MDHDVHPERMGTVAITFSPRGRRVAVPRGTTILRAAQQAGVDITATCGARGRCRSCRVQVIAGPAPPATLADRIQLGDDEVRERYRLACETEVWDDLTVLVAPDAEDASFQILTKTSGLRSATVRVLDAGVRKEFVPAVTLSVSAGAGSAWEDLERLCGPAIAQAPISVLRRMPSLARGRADGLTLALFDRALLAVEQGDTSAETFGMAFDLGTTTVVGYLVDVKTATVAATVSGLNPQAAFGGDLMSRVAFAQERPSNVRTLQVRILRFINGLIEEACGKAGVRRDRIYKVVVVGNTVMHHTFLGLDPTSVGRAPFTPVVRGSVRLAASEAGLRLNPSTPVFLLPLVAGFVGADAVAMVLATRIDESPQPRIAVDIGTNGEVVVGSREGLLACSAPAGPALEGAQIRCGMRATRGAIDRVTITRSVQAHVIGEGPPMGMCGSGVLDAVAGLLEAGLLDPSGRLVPDPPASLADDLRSRVVALPDGSLGFALVRDTETGTGRHLVLTQADIRQVQLAKAAIRSGVTILQLQAGTPNDEIAELLLAGAFGNYLNVGSALRVGLIPPLPRDRISYVGNAAGLGAQLALVSETERRHADHLATRVRHVSVADHPEFHTVFVEALRFE